jgi:solute carrier family 25 carnitine/acylcarnitine transporter 20/29
LSQPVAQFCPLLFSFLFQTQLQTQVFKPQPKFTTFPGTVSYIVRNHGIRGVYQGIAPTICRNVPAVAGYFGAYEYARRALLAPGQKLEQLESWKLLTAGSIGGLAYWVLTYPIDVMKSAVQADSCAPAERRFKGLADVAKQLYAEGGVKRFFKGVTPCLLRAAPANATCFFLYQKTVEFLG